MRTVGVRELKQRASQVLRQLQHGGEEVEVTHRGRVVARLVPVRRARARSRTTRAWATLDRVAREIGRRWPKGRAAATAVREGRRGL
jgi:prevent-host-death family protein